MRQKDVDIGAFMQPNPLLTAWQEEYIRFRILDIVEWLSGFKFSQCNFDVETHGRVIRLE